MRLLCTYIFSPGSKSRDPGLQLRLQSHRKAGLGEGCVTLVAVKVGEEGEMESQGSASLMRAGGRRGWVLESKGEF